MLCLSLSKVPNEVEGPAALVSLQNLLALVLVELFRGIWLASFVDCVTAVVSVWGTCD